MLGPCRLWHAHAHQAPFWHTKHKIRRARGQHKHTHWPHMEHMGASTRGVQYIRRRPVVQHTIQYNAVPVQRSCPHLSPHTVRLFVSLFVVGATPPFRSILCIASGRMSPLSSSPSRIQTARAHLALAIVVCTLFGCSAVRFDSSHSAFVRNRSKRRNSYWFFFGWCFGRSIRACILYLSLSPTRTLCVCAVPVLMSSVYYFVVL